MVGSVEMNDSSNNEIVSITHLSSDSEGAYFKIKGRYKMRMKILYSFSDTMKYVTGDYCFRVLTNKK